jgi:hypothetical protein
MFKQIKNKAVHLGLVVGTAATMFAGSVFASPLDGNVTTENLQTVAQTATQNLSATSIIFIVITVLASIGLFVSGLMGLHKVISQGHSSQMSIAAPITKIGISALLLFSLYLANVLDTSLFGGNDAGMSNINVIKQSGFDTNNAL